MIDYRLSIIDHMTVDDWKLTIVRDADNDEDDEDDDISDDIDRWLIVEDS